MKFTACSKHFPVDEFENPTLRQQYGIFTSLEAMFLRGGVLFITLLLPATYV
jgi:hypothetical protein